MARYLHPLEQMIYIEYATADFEAFQKCHNGDEGEGRSVKELPCPWIQNT